ncbi:YtxH domain-containing protein [Paenibacillus hamazuiensis]|uniref:YtxH domain-containing protein n=1 Tax=Paenibacillus hamazuiensis TaxID=2936508 RepID=UPI00200D4695|nr:YtxH domain-containing protein [Paenibacillus hamazuiensis]
MANQKGKDLLIGAVVGGVLGAVTALLFAPKSGRELRADIAEQYHNVSEKTQEIAGQIAEKSKEIAKTVSEQSTEIVGKTKEAALQLGEKVKSWKGAAKVEDSAADEVAAAALEQEDK